jgi:Flp pilus assembly protein TadD
MASERPKKLKSDELEQYNALLEEQAFPFEEQAISIYEINTKRAPEGVYDESVRKSFEALAKLKPARYGKVEHSDGWVAMLTAPAGAAAPNEAAVADYGRATALANDGRLTEAELQLQQFELQYPGFAAPAIDLGLLARAQGKLDESETALRRATTLDPGNAIAWSELGVTLRYEGKFNDARAAYGQAIASDDTYAAEHCNLGVLLDLYLDDPAAALPEFERYKELSGEDRPVATWIAELRARTGIKAAPAGDTVAPEAPGAPEAPPADAPVAADNNGGAT